MYGIVRSGKDKSLKVSVSFKSVKVTKDIIMSKKCNTLRQLCLSLPDGTHQFPFMETLRLSEDVEHPSFQPDFCTMRVAVM